VNATAASVRGDVVHFVALDDERLVIDEDEPEAAVAPLAAAASATVPPPHRAEAVRQQGDRWAVAVSRISVAHVPGLAGEEAELVASRDGLSLHVDGRPRFDAVPTLERAGETQGREYVVRASRLAGDLWEVEATAL
jgi:hypothetical protein